MNRLCMHDDGYHAEPGRRKCSWHLLLKMPMEDQIAAAAERRAGKDALNCGLEPVARMSKILWPEGERWCSGCQDFVPLFYCSGSRCKAHAAESSHASRLEAVYGIDRGTYLALLELQGGLCYVCHQEPKTKRLAVDHDHKTGEVRGLLCADVERGCNKAVLGSLEARSVDGPVRAAYRLIDYLQKTPYQRLKEATDGETVERSEGRGGQDPSGAGSLEAGGRLPGESRRASGRADAPAPGADRFHAHPDEPGGAEAVPVPGAARRPVERASWEDDPDWTF